jgi:tetratricopeptide (TPR) repeat protein
MIPSRIRSRRGSRSKGAVSAVVLLAALSLARPALAQDAAIAENLYQEGQTLMAAGKTEEACEKFAASHRLDPAPGTVLNLAACHEKLGKDASAWAEYKEAQALSARRGDKRREEYAAQKIEALEKHLHRVVIEILSPLQDMKVTLDGRPLVREAWGTGLALDPGLHKLEVSAPGYTTWRRELNMGPSSGTDRIEVPKLEKASDTAAAAGPVTAMPPADPKPAPAIEPEHPVAMGSSGSTKRTVGFVAAGAGVLSLGAALVFALRTKSLASDRDGLCPAGQPCFKQAAFDADQDAHVAQQWMFITGAAGIVLGGAGAYLILTSRDAPPSRSAQRFLVVPHADATGAGLAAVGRF